MNKLLTSLYFMSGIGVNSTLSYFLFKNYQTSQPFENLLYLLGLVFTGTCVLDYFVRLVRYLWSKK